MSFVKESFGNIDSNKSKNDFSGLCCKKYRLLLIQILFEINANLKYLTVQLNLTKVRRDDSWIDCYGNSTIFAQFLHFTLHDSAKKENK